MLDKLEYAKERKGRMRRCCTACHCVEVPLPYERATTQKRKIAQIAENYNQANFEIGSTKTATTFHVPAMDILRGDN